MDGVFLWQIGVIASILVARFMSRDAMFGVAVFWTIWSVFLIWKPWLAILQVSVTWGGVALVQSVFAQDKSGSVPKPARAEAGSVSSNFTSSKTGSRPVADIATRNVASVRSSQVGNAKTPPKTHSCGQLAPFSEDRGQEKPSSPNRRTESAQEKSNGGLLDQMSEFIDETAAKVYKAHAIVVANEDIGLELSRFRIWLNAALRRGEDAVKFKLRLEQLGLSEEAFDAEFRRIFDESSSAKDKEAEFFLVDLSLKCGGHESLPSGAYEERMEKLAETRRLITRAHDRVVGNNAILVAIDDLIEQSFLGYLSRQLAIINEYESDLTNAIKPASPEAHVDFPKGNASSQRSASKVFPSNGVSFSNGASQTMVEEKGMQCREITAEDREQIKATATSLGIPHLVHFTRVDNLGSILQFGLMSVQECVAEGVNFVRNDKMRLDRKLNSISLSIACPNYRMLYKYRQEEPGADWVILLLSPRILWEKSCAFYPKNAASSDMRGASLEEMQGAEALRAMFSHRYGNREEWLRGFDPTDPQAEVMVHEKISPNLIQAVAFETKAAEDRHRAILRGTESFSAGPGNGLFASRQRIRRH